MRTSRHWKEATGSLTEAFSWAKWFFSIRREKSAIRLLSLQRKHVGDRCFIIGNGPSLKETDLSLLKYEFSFGLNRIFLAFEERSFQPTYLVAVNRLVIEQSFTEINNLDMPKFLNWDFRNYIRFDKNTILLRPINHIPFSTDLTTGVRVGSTVTYVAMQLAFYMGFKQVILIGVDHSFETKGPPNKEVVTTDIDPNHFSPDYFGKGFRWNLPDLAGSEEFYQIAKTMFEKDGREIIDATIGGKLEIFNKIDYNEIQFK